MTFFHRSGKGAGRWLPWKVRAFSVGAGLTLAGIYLESDWIITLAIVFLVAGFFLRFLPDGEKEEEAEEEEGDLPGTPASGESGGGEGEE